ncbi:hypothetical protein PMAYCL1PPCAC_04145, partial [Pristionchus mayeri]
SSIELTHLYLVRGHQSADLIQASGRRQILGLLDHLLRVDDDVARAIVHLKDADESIGQLEHVVAQRDDDELRVLRTILDVVADDGDVSEVERRIDLVHHVQRSGPESMKSEDEGERGERFLASRQILDLLPRLLRRAH